MPEAWQRSDQSTPTQRPQGTHGADSKRVHYDTIVDRVKFYRMDDINLLLKPLSPYKILHRNLLVRYSRFVPRLCINTYDLAGLLSFGFSLFMHDVLQISVTVADGEQKRGANAAQ